MAFPLRFPGEQYLLPRRFEKIVIPQASVRTLFSVPYTILPTNAEELPFLEIITIEKLNGIAYSGGGSSQVIIDAVTPPSTTTAAFTLTLSLVLGITSGKSVFRNYGGNDNGGYANSDYSFGKFYRIRLGAGGDFTDGTGDVIIQMFYSVVPKVSKLFQ